MHGVSALIAGQRGEWASVDAHLDAADNLPMLTTADRENCDFLVVAEALALEHAGKLGAALDALAPILDPTFAPMMLRHQWLPEVARIATAAEDHTRGQLALYLCESEARKESVPARAGAAAARCRAVLHRDADEALPAAAHYRHVGRLYELGLTLEEIAVLLAQQGRQDEAIKARREASELYERLRATWLEDRLARRIGPSNSSDRFKLET
jgi:tetratricopeptide (TPR) repeat protein